MTIMNPALIREYDGYPVIFLQHAEALLAEKDRQIENLKNQIASLEMSRATAAAE